MSPIGAGNRGVDEAAICPSVVPVALAQNWLEKKAVKSIFGLPRECTIADIDDVIESFVVRFVPASRSSADRFACRRERKLPSSLDSTVARSSVFSLRTLHYTDTPCSSTELTDSSSRNSSPPYVPFVLDVMCED